MTLHRFLAVVIGCSTGGLDALYHILPALPRSFSQPVIVVSHTTADGGARLAELLEHKCLLPVRVAEDKGKINKGTIYVAPGGYHLLAESDHSFSLSMDEKVCNVRPSIDVLFESAAEVWEDRLLAILLTGGNNDGTAGLKAIREAGGMTIAQDPITAEADIMPRSAIAAHVVDRILPLSGIGAALTALSTLPQEPWPTQAQGA